MSALVDAVRDKVSEKCCVSRLRKGACRILIPDHMEPFRLIDMDHPEAPTGEEDARCDFLFIGGRMNLVAPMEFKRGSPKAGRVLKQLQTGARMAEDLIPRNVKDVAFRPVVVYGGQMRKCQIRAIRRGRISFRKVPRIAKLIKCGQPLDRAL